MGQSRPLRHRVILFPGLPPLERKSGDEGRQKMTFRYPIRRDVLKTATAFLTVSMSAKRLGLSAAARVPEKIVLGAQPITPFIESYLGATDFFKEEGLTVEVSRFNSFAPVLQALAAGNLAVGGMGVAPSIIGISRGLPIIAPSLVTFVTPRRPLERIMVMPNSPIRTINDLQGKKLAFLGPGTVPDMMLDALPMKSSIRKDATAKHAGCAGTGPGGRDLRDPAGRHRGRNQIQRPYRGECDRVGTVCRTEHGRVQTRVR
jgi:hypothetical protein